VLLAQDRIREYFAIEPEKAINMVIALGYPSDTPKKLPRKEVADIIRIIE
jgi:nitroreductase